MTEVFMRRAFVMCGLVLSFAGVAMAGLSGTYTVKPQGGGDFASLGELADTIYAVGLSGDCVFLVDSADYSSDWFEIADTPPSDTFVVTIKPAPGQHVWYDGRGWGFGYTQVRIKIVGFDFAADASVMFMECAPAKITGCSFLRTWLDIEHGHDDTIAGNRLTWCSVRYGRDEVIADNVFSVSDSTDSYVGLCLSQGPGTKVYYNTFYVDVDRMWGCCDVDYDSTDVKNNVFVVRGESTLAALEWNSYHGFVHTADYNCFWPEPPATVVYDAFTSQHYSLTEWQAVGQDLHSIEADPMITGPLDPHLLEGSPCIGAGVPIPGFEYDIDGDPRDPVHPDIGCDEFTGAGVAESARKLPVQMLSVTPNPTSGSVTVSAPTQIAVDVYDAAGRLVRRLALNSGRATLSGLEPGVYVLRAGTASAKLTVTD